MLSRKKIFIRCYTCKIRVFLFILFFIMQSAVTHAQKIQYNYDAMGNRASRLWQFPMIRTLSNTQQVLFKVLPSCIVSEYIEINYDGNQTFVGEFSYTLSTTNGIVVKSGKSGNDNIKIDVTDLKTGTYLLSIVYNDYHQGYQIFKTTL